MKFYRIMRLSAAGFTLALLLATMGTTEILQAQQVRPDPPAKELTAEEKAKGRTLFMRGITEFELENYGEAVTYLTEAIQFMEPSSGVYYSLSEAYFNTGDMVNAARYGTEAVKLEPGNKWYRLNLVDIYKSAGRNQATLDELEKTLEYHPNDLDILYMLAQEQANQGHHLKSNETYNEIRRRTGPDFNLLYQKYRNFFALGMRDSSITTLEQMRGYEPDNMATLKALSQLYLEDDNKALALKVLEDALERNPRDPETILAMSDIHAAGEEWDEAGKLLETLVADDLINPDIKAEVVQYLVARFQRDPSSEPLKRNASRLVDLLNEKHNDYGLGHALAADFYILAGDNEKTIAALNKTTELMPENEMAWQRRVQILFGEGLYEEAINAGIEGDQMIPDDVYILFFTGLAYSMNNRKQEALAWLERAADVPARRELRSDIHGTIGDTYSALDNWPEAEKAYDRALQYNSENDVALNNYAYYLSVRGLRLDDAMDMAKRAVEMRPGNPAFLDTLGWIYFKKGDYENAREHIAAAIDTGQASATVMEHMGDVYEKLGDMDEARNWWQQAYDSDGTRHHLREKLDAN
jgi:tetratricopeptide (TPR) repeat protein